MIVIVGITLVPAFGEKSQGREHGSRPRRRRGRARCRQRSLGVAEAQAADANRPIVGVGRDGESEAAGEAQHRVVHA